MLGLDVLELLGSVFRPGLCPCKESEVLKHAGCTYIRLGVVRLWTSRRVCVDQS